jgi:hypothetical protein
MKTNQEWMEAKIEANNKKVEVLQEKMHQSWRDEDHVEGLSRKEWGKSRRTEVHLEESGRCRGDDRSNWGPNEGKCRSCMA